MANNGIAEAETKRIAYFSLNQLRFDPSNPRLPSNVDRTDSRVLLEWMLDDSTIIELMRSIGENDYFHGEPLLVVREKKKEDIYLVVEGNRRLAAALLLSNPKLAPIRKQAVLEASRDAKFKPQELPAIIYPDRESILNYLGYRHITGIKEWDSLAKAKYLEQLRKTFSGLSQQEQFQSLAKMIGTKSAYVGRLLTGLALYKKIENRRFFKLKGVDEQSISFSLITTALAYNNIIRYLGLASNTEPSLKRLNEDNLEEFTKWVFEKTPENTTRLGESRNLRKLNAILGNKGALAAFKQGISLHDAALLTGVPTQVFRLAITKAKVHLQNARDYIHKVKDATKADAEILMEIEQLASFLNKSVQSLFVEKSRAKAKTEN